MRTVENLKNELVKLICDIVGIPSVNLVLAGPEADSLRGGESAVNRHLSSVMEDIGLTTDLWEETPGRANLVGTCRGSGS